MKDKFTLGSTAVKHLNLSVFNVWMCRDLHTDRSWCRVCKSKSSSHHQVSWKKGVEYWINVLLTFLELLLFLFRSGVGTWQVVVTSIRVWLLDVWGAKRVYYGPVTIYYLTRKWSYCQISIAVRIRVDILCISGYGEFLVGHWGRL